MNPRNESAAGWANNAVSELPKMTATQTIIRLKPGIRTWFGVSLKIRIEAAQAGQFCSSWQRICAIAPIIS
jgi:hypothetical protein